MTNTIDRDDDGTIHAVHLPEGVVRAGVRAGVRVRFLGDRMWGDAQFTVAEVFRVDLEPTRGNRRAFGYLPWTVLVMTESGVPRALIPGHFRVLDGQEHA